MRLIFAAGNGQAVNAEDMTIKKIRLVAGSTDATAIVYSAGTAISYMSAIAKTTDSDPAVSGGNPFEGIKVKGPVTVDVV